MYSRHAQQRMQQRGISSQAVEWLLDFGHADYHRGREIFFWSRKSLARLAQQTSISHQQCQRLRRHYLVLDDEEIVTVGHRTTHFKRDRH